VREITTSPALAVLIMRAARWTAMPSTSD
jgi:hypothetical protein